jgi:hypothetical protein
MDTGDKEGVSRSEARQRVYAGLLWLREQKGYKAGYPRMKFLAIFGERPNGEVNAEPPVGELMAWLRRDIARWKASKRAKEAAQLRSPLEPKSELMTAADWEAGL